MRLSTAADIAYVVRGRDGRVVAAFWGGDAQDEARTWTEKGYHVERVDRAAGNEGRVKDR